ncbi:MAG: ATP-binding protein [Clostridiaceae bacterium]
MENEITYLGRVINVDSNNVEIEVSKKIPSCSPIINGRVYKIGQIGTLVKFPIGSIIIFGIVTSVSNFSNVQIKNLITNSEPDYGTRYLTVQLIGEKVGNYDFEKGIGTYPTINDEVHLVIEEDLKFIYGEKKAGYIEIGRHSTSQNLPVYIDLQNLVLRHSSILGSTGSGKSNTTANIIKNILNNYNGSRIVLIDPHGEYTSAFKDYAKVFAIDDDKNPLLIPFWAMTFDELGLFLVGRKPGEERPEDKRLREKVLELKLKNINKLKSGSVKSEYITADSPIPFDIRQMWYDFNREVFATYSIADISKQNSTTEKLISEGDSLKLIPAKFEPYTSSNTEPYKAKNQTMNVYEIKINSRLRDSRFDFLFNPGQYSNVDGRDISDLLKEWIDHDKKLTILDLSGIPFELIDISVGLITRIIYDSMFWGRFESYTGRNRPLLMIYEEAHSYLPKTEASSHVYGYAKKAVEKIFKEGRKFGIGAMVVTQRPSEISETILAQAGTFIALRLTNSGDKNQVQSAAPNNMSSLIDLLPSLRIGEAIVLGEAIKIPTRVRIQLVEPRPDSNDPNVIKCWSNRPIKKPDDYKKVVTAWRQQIKLKRGE